MPSLRILAGALLAALLSGTASAAFLKALDWITDFRTEHAAVVLGLPLAGFLLGWLYHRHGSEVEGGTNLLLDEIHDPRSVVPGRMAPLILLTTWMTHLFGGSAGREGTAIQMGAGLADQLSRPLGLAREERRLLLMAGMAAGFGSVFGTPWAGIIFGLEVLAVSQELRLRALFPCALASLLADGVTQAWGIRHGTYSLGVLPELSVPALAATLAAGGAFGLTARLFVVTHHAIASFFTRAVRYPPLRPLFGGLLLLLAMGAIAQSLGELRYSGLGISGLEESFQHHVAPYDWLGKLWFTALTLGSGFKGGEVTPLFYMGATLGNALSWLLPLPIPFLAGLGLVTVFGAAAHTPFTTVVLAAELFGWHGIGFATLCAGAAHAVSGPVRIYRPRKRQTPTST